MENKIRPVPVAAEAHPQFRRSSVQNADLLFPDGADRLSSNARASVVNRTHRVVRERARQIQDRRNRARDLVLPLGICSAVLLIVCYAISTTVCGSAFSFASVGSEIGEAGKLLSGGATDAGGEFYLLLIWFLPVSAVTLAVALFRRSRGRSAGRSYDEAIR